jgi:zinc D-Ala-D-Ala carboxypeptidase
MNLTPHLTLDEACRTSTGLPNTPGEVATYNLRACGMVFFEPLRELWGNKATKLTSGFRSNSVNIRVGGSPTSKHKEGLAFDVIPPIDRLEAFLMAKEVIEKPGGLWVDQIIIYENKPHLHIGTCYDRQARRQVLVDPGDGHAVPWDTYEGPLKKLAEEAWDLS